MEDIKEEFGGMGSGGGLGDVTSASVSLIPGDVSGSIAGSLDVSHGLRNLDIKQDDLSDYHIKKKRKKGKKKRRNRIKTFNEYLQSIKL